MAKKQLSTYEKAIQDPEFKEQYNKEYSALVQSEAEILPARRGAPTKYKVEMCDVIKAVATDGGFHAAMMVACGITNDTFYRWQREIPEFREAVAQADLISLALQEAALMDGMMGRIKNYNFNANAMILNNKYKALYTRGEGSGNTEVTINTINLTPDQMDIKISQKLEKLRSMGIDLKSKED